ncbi:NifB/NifX family molybdenum-iron cluster-binding protein [Desulfosarcina cetonica]|uniref:NifB/NifX family molybdenum-iron cluster-binding protein n=1 Tax=Desulfosarcina cetonica TaxID=90730 RepID=UPI001C4466F8|nr:NifB/NifX family molybdenum-iron cluster-binding protein [Desulfosarcina cetonica]
MKIAVSSTGTDLSANVDERFGRCRYFLFVETDDMAFEAIDNTNADLTSSAGIQSAGIVADAGAKVVITGNCGPKAMQVFDAANVRVILGQRGVIRDVVEKFKKGELDASIGGNLQQPVGGGIGRGVPYVLGIWKRRRSGNGWWPRSGRLRRRHGHGPPMHGYRWRHPTGPTARSRKSSQPAAPTTAATGRRAKTAIGGN